MKKVFFILAAAVALVSCQKESFQTNADRLEGTMKGLQYDENGVAFCAPDVTTLWGGQTIEEGYVEISNDGTNLYVKYVVTNPGVTLEQVHVWAGTDFTNLDNGGTKRPAPGQMPYIFENLSGTEYVVTIPLADVVLSTSEYCGQNVYVVTHAALSDGETAFGGNLAGAGASWWYYYQYQICCADTPPPAEYYSETAFAKFSKEEGGYVFTSGKNSNPEKYPSLNLTQNRWGWAANLSAGSFTADVYAGAGLNKISNGILVGKLYVDVTATEVTVKYELTGDYKMSEVHLYVSDSKPVTLAPGQYGHTMYFDPKVNTYEYTFSVEDLDGDGKFWLIAHAVAEIPVMN